MKMERFNEILNKLMQMEDAEENLEMVPLYEEALELSKEIYGEYNLIPGYFTSHEETSA